MKRAGHFGTMLGAVLFLLGTVACARAQAADRKPVDFVFNDSKGREVFTISSIDGHVKLAPGMTADAASLAFWQTLQRVYPAAFECKPDPNCGMQFSAKPPAIGSVQPPSPSGKGK